MEVDEQAARMRRNQEKLVQAVRRGNMWKESQSQSHPHHSCMGFHHVYHKGNKKPQIIALHPFAFLLVTVDDGNAWEIHFTGPSYQTNRRRQTLLSPTIPFIIMLFQSKVLDNKILSSLMTVPMKNILLYRHHMINWIIIHT